MKWTRKQYMNHECTHREYYGQFVTESHKWIVLHSIGSKQFLTEAYAKDPNLNNISLQQWDRLSQVYQDMTSIQEDENGKRFWSLCTGGCIFKEAAIQIIEGE